ncbi:MAG: hypothetical protein WAU72_03290 [Acidimicrobiia bacterium]|jgi:trehalose-phosphatase
MSYIDVVSDLDGTLSNFTKLSKDARLDPGVVKWLETSGRTYRNSSVLNFTPLTGRSPVDLLRLIDGKVDLFDGIMTDFGMSKITADGSIIDWNCGGDVDVARRLRTVGVEAFKRASGQILELEIPGLYVEEKRYGGAIHTRPTEEFLPLDEIKALEEEFALKILEMVEGIEGVDVKRGSRCVEIAPAISKLNAFLAHRKVSATKSISAFFGDDIPDLEVLKHVSNEGGLAVLVGDHLDINHPRLTKVDNPFGTIEKLQLLLDSQGMALDFTRM